MAAGRTNGWIVMPACAKAACWRMPSRLCAIGKNRRRSGSAEPFHSLLQRLIHVDEAARGLRDARQQRLQQESGEVLAVHKARAGSVTRLQAEEVPAAKQALEPQLAFPAQLALLA